MTDPMVVDARSTGSPETVSPILVATLLVLAVTMAAIMGYVGLKVAPVATRLAQSI